MLTDIGFSNMRYVALAPSQEKFDEWAKRFNIDGEAIYAVPERKITQEIIDEVKTLGDFGLIIFPRTQQNLSSIKNSLVDELKSLAKEQFSLLDVRPVTLAGYITKWRKAPR